MKQNYLDALLAMIRLEAKWADDMGQSQNFTICAETIEDLRSAILPFARMARKGSDPTEVACTRGVAGDLTMITSADFDKAAHALCLDFNPNNPFDAEDAVKPQSKHSGAGS